MSPGLRSVLLGTAGLTVAALVALGLTLSRGGIVADAASLRATRRIAAVAVLLQAVHFGEELVTGFAHRFPALLGLPPWSPAFFVSFNLCWLAVWVVSLPGLAARRRAALFPLWFLAIGGLANGLAHPSFALRTGGYVPGLLTSPFVGLAGLWLLGRLGSVTVPHRG
jgi:hypothetical protein